MNTLMKSLGVLILLIGVGILTIPAFTDIRDNMILLVGLIVVVLGAFMHIFLNRRFE